MGPAPCQLWRGYELAHGDGGGEYILILQHKSTVEENLKTMKWQVKVKWTGNTPRRELHVEGFSQEKEEEWIS